MWVVHRERYSKMTKRETRARELRVQVEANLKCSLGST
jgi:hypothetical protein